MPSIPSLGFTHISSSSLFPTKSSPKKNSPNPEILLISANILLLGLKISSNMYSPEAISRDISNNLMFSSNTSSGANSFRNGFLDGDFFKSSKEILNSSSDLFQQPASAAAAAHFQQQNGGLMRYRSAPSAYFASYLDSSKDNNNTTNTNTSGGSNTNGDSSESDSMFSAFLNEPTNESPYHHQRNNPHQHQQQVQPQGSCGAMKLEMNEVESNPSGMQQNRNGNGFCSSNSSSSTMVSVGYQAAVCAGGGTVVGSYTVPLGVENPGQVRMNSNANGSNLIRQSSSPAGFFSGTLFSIIFVDFLLVCMLINMDFSA